MVNGVRVFAAVSLHISRLAGRDCYSPFTIYYLLPSSFCRRGVYHALYFGDAVGGEAAALGVLAHGRLVRRDVDAVDLVSRDVTLDPLNLRPHLPQHPAGLLRDALQLFRRHVARAG